MISLVYLQYSLRKTFVLGIKIADMVINTLTACFMLRNYPKRRQKERDWVVEEEKRGIEK